ncbi:MAG: ABC transporter ATP-binding protein [Anaerolineae bacterium]|nr:ABC transporter ATP-binding protein [Anaerolineae bacterium]
MTTTYTVEVNDVHKRFGSVHALQGLSLKTRKGEIYGLLGPNGAGKSTLIRTIIGLHEPDSGSVTVLGHNMPSKTVLSRTGYMTQASALYNDLTVYQNIAFFAGLMGCRDRAAIEEAIAFVDLTERMHSPVGTLSGGMRQRVSLASVLPHKPELILLDEPTVGVDPQLRFQFWDHFRQMTAQGITLIVSSHVMDEAERCDRLGFVRQGQLIAEGTSESLRQQAGKDNIEEAFLYLAEQKGVLNNHE